MKRKFVGMLSAAVLAMTAGMGAADAKTLGIVALLANDALNIDVIGGATKAATEAGWDVRVIDTQASADQANAAMSSFAVQQVDAIFVLAFASSAIGSGLEAAKSAGIPVATWGGEIVEGIVVTTSGQTVGKDSVDFLVSQIGDAPAEVLALTFHPGKLCIDRGMAFDAGVEGKDNINVTYHEVVVPGQVENGNAAAANWLIGNPAGGEKKLAIWSCWDEPTQGAVAALRQAGRDDVITVSINGSPQGVQLVRNGDMTATVWQPAFAEGEAVFQAILDSIEAGESWEPKTIEIPGVVVTGDNVDTFMADHPAN